MNNNQKLNATFYPIVRFMESDYPIFLLSGDNLKYTKSIFLANSDDEKIFKLDKNNYKITNLDNYTDETEEIMTEIDKFVWDLDGKNSQIIIELPDEIKSNFKGQVLSFLPENEKNTIFDFNVNSQFTVPGKFKIDKKDQKEIITGEINSYKRYKDPLGF